MSSIKDSELGEKDVGAIGVAEPSSAPHSASGDLRDHEIDHHEEAALVWKLDRHIAPVAMILYLIAFLDRSNIGNAAVGGMTTDLNFPPSGLSVATSIFYVTYVVFETPATILLRSLRPSLMIPGVVVVWGAVSLGNGFATSYGVVLACRLLLGLCEAALSPCLVLYMTTFYRREELALRLCYLYMSSALSGTIGGLVAAGILKMEGMRGLRGWQWLYIIEGALTIAWGFACFYLMADNYDHARYLTDRQKYIMRVRAAKEEEYSKDAGFSWVEIRKAFMDPIIYLSGFVQFCVDLCLYGFSTFLVVIINQFGFDKIASQGITAPVYFFCAAVYLVGAIVSMRYNIRYKVLIVLSIPTMVGYAVLMANPASMAGRLVGCFLAGSGIYIGVGLHVTWLGQNIAGFRKRSTSVGMQQTIGNIGGVVAGQIYRSRDKPGYRLGHAVSFAFWVAGMVGMTAEYYIWKRRNAKRAVMTDDEKRAIDEKGITGDHHYSFHYSL